MSPSTLSFLLVYSVLASTTPLGTRACEEVQRIELPRQPTGVLEVCVRPQSLTEFTFDAPVVVHVQDENRFEQVTRSPTSLQVLPPRDLAPGERIRLSVTYPDRQGQETFLLDLMGMEGPSTRHVEISRSPRVPDVNTDALAAERIESQRLQAELARLERELHQLRETLMDPRRLTGLVASSSISNWSGIKMRAFAITSQAPPVAPSTRQGLCYRSAYRVVVDMGKVPAPLRPWRAENADAWDAEGQKLEIVSIERASGRLLIEFAAEWGRRLGAMTLRLRAEDIQDWMITGIECD
ncbi:DUF2381 family protein [Archangium primigenium]|uniref:DUF2381 family protein n=1 Tax=[Archangium] primigenium TaxID=2792470 RepID=UPI00195D4A44|nr:DUF2381 family protein [Archangium primigenium]MBM7117513.1 DUF2381 family protein [Archangium primigenium]